MKKSIRILAFSKINLHLKVLNKREDGFHNIESLFQEISISDSIKIFRKKGEKTTLIKSPGFFLPKNNTVLMAVNEFRKTTGVEDGICVLVKKRIPAGAGLGGGSSDAASTLLALNSLFKTRLKDEQLMKMASVIGSDVPFFLKGGAAIVTGRGEIIKPIKSRSDLFGVLIWPEIHSSTAKAYELVSQWKLEQKYSYKWLKLEEIEQNYNEFPKKWKFKNIFLPPLENDYSVIKDIILDFYKLGALFSSMSGAGTSVFAIFDNKKLAKKVYSKMSKKWKFSYKFFCLHHSKCGSTI